MEFKLATIHDIPIFIMGIGAMIFALIKSIISLVQDFCIGGLLVYCLLLYPLILCALIGYIWQIVLSIKEYKKSKQKEDNSQKRGDKEQ